MLPPELRAVRPSLRTSRSSIFTVRKLSPQKPRRIYAFNGRTESLTPGSVDATPPTSALPPLGLLLATCYPKPYAPSQHLLKTPFHHIILYVRHLARQIITLRTTPLLTPARERHHQRGRPPGSRQPPCQRPRRGHQWTKRRARCRPRCCCHRRWHWKRLRKWRRHPWQRQRRRNRYHWRRGRWRSSE